MTAVLTEPALDTARRDYTPQGVADAFGLKSRNPVVRACERGDLRHVRTPGGHYRIAGADALAWWRSFQTPAPNGGVK